MDQRRENSREVLPPNGVDELIRVRAGLQVADAQTKSMTPHYLKKVLRECVSHVASEHGM